MNIRLWLVFATLAKSVAVLGQPPFIDSQFFDGGYVTGYAANLNVGDSVLNITNDGLYGGFYSAGATANNCANIYVMDPQEEEIACCSCLNTPNGLYSLSVKNDLIGNTLTPAAPSSVVIKVLTSEPAADSNGNLTICNPATAGSAFALILGGATKAWGSTIEPAASAGTYTPLAVPYLSGNLSASEYTSLTSVCNLIQAEGSGFGICNACRVGALQGAKK